MWGSSGHFRSLSVSGGGGTRDIWQPCCFPMNGSSLFISIGCMVHSWSDVEPCASEDPQWWHIHGAFLPSSSVISPFYAILECFVFIVLLEWYLYLEILQFFIIILLLDGTLNDALHFLCSKQSCRVLVSHDDYSLLSKLPQEKTSVVTIMRNPLDRVFGSYEFSVEVAARFLVHPNLTFSQKMASRMRPKFTSVSTLDIWPWKHLVPWMKVDLFARVC